MKTKHPYKIFRKKRSEDVSEEFMFEECRKHVVSAPIECVNWFEKEGKSGCSCLSSTTKDGKEPETSKIASYMVRFYNFRHEKKDSTLANVIGRNGVEYCLDFMVDSSDRENQLRGLKVCRFSLGYLLDFRRTRWENIRRHSQKKTQPLYGKKAKDHKLIGELDYQDVDEFFLKIQASGGVLQHQVKSKRQLYNLFCRERGWSVSTSKTGAVKTNFAGEIPKPILARSTFNSYWKKNFPHVVVGNSKKIEGSNSDEDHDNNVAFGENDDRDDNVANPPQNANKMDDEEGYYYCVVRTPFRYYSVVRKSFRPVWWPAIIFDSPIAFENSLSKEEKKLLGDEPDGSANRRLADYKEAHASGKDRDVVRFLVLSFKCFYSDIAYHEENRRYQYRDIIFDHERGLEKLKEQEESSIHGALPAEPEFSPNVQQYKKAVNQYKEQRNPYWFSEPNCSRI